MMLLNNTIVDNTSFSEKKLENGLSIYEVIRIFKGQPIFLKDNLLRLSNSIKKSNIQLDIQNLHIEDKLNKVILLEHMEEGNLKYVLHFNGNHPDEYVYRIPHSYPGETDYENGVPTVSYHAIRQNPEIKYINLQLREATNRLIAEKHVYEVVLIDDEGYVTEGSRSNLFFIKENRLYTAPTDYVLPGTCRKRVIDICNANGFHLTEERVAYNSLRDYDAAFITGTSPLILPISGIDDVHFNVNNPLLRNLMNIYFSLIKNVF